MKIRLIILFSGFSFGGLQAQTVLEVLAANEIIPERQIEGDIWVTDTLQTNDFYQLLFISSQDTISLFEAKLKPCRKDSLILGVKGYESDMQCTAHPSRFYTVKDKHKSIYSIENTFIISPSLIIEEEKVMAIFKKHLQELKEVYLGEEGTLEQVFSEIYTPKYSFSPNSDIYQLTYTVCDYIIVNLGIFSEEEWQTISNVQSVSVSFPD